MLTRRQRRLLAVGMVLAIIGNIAALTLVPWPMWSANITSALVCLGALVFLVRRQGV